MILTGYLARINTYPSNEEKVLVMRNRGNNELAPSKNLLRKWKAGQINWKEYENIFLKEMNNPKSQSRLAKIARKVTNEDVRLICYEGEDKHCHRNILKTLVKKKLKFL